MVKWTSYTRSEPSHRLATTPAARGKRVARGAIFDVAVDIRRGSPGFERHAAAALTADNW
jgi:dTDP-4-dehydrorhamnose 3,5-epimerase-like enzyme